MSNSQLVLLPHETGDENGVNHSRRSSSPTVDVQNSYRSLHFYLAKLRPTDQAHWTGSLLSGPFIQTAQYDFCDFALLSVCKKCYLLSTSTLRSPSSIGIRQQTDKFPLERACEQSRKCRWRKLYLNWNRFCCPRRYISEFLVIFIFNNFKFFVSLKFTQT